MSHLIPFLADTWHQTLTQILKSKYPCSDHDLEWIQRHWDAHIQKYPPPPPPPPLPRFHTSLWVEAPAETSRTLPTTAEVFNSGGFKRVGSQTLPESLDQIKAYTYSYDDWFKLIKRHSENESILIHLIETEPTYWRRAHRVILSLEVPPEIRLMLAKRVPPKRPTKKGHPSKRRAKKRR